MDSRSELNLNDIAEILKRRFRTFFKLCAATLLATCFVALIIPRTYKASSEVIIQNDINLYPQELASQPLQEEGSFLRTQKEIMNSSLIIKTALKNAQDKGLNKRYAYDNVKRRISVNYIEDSNLLGVNVYMPRPEEAVELANAMANAFIYYHKNVKVGDVDKNLDLVKKQLSGLRQEMDRLKTKLTEISDKEQLSFYKAKVPLYVTNIIDMEKRNLNTEADLRRLKEELTKTQEAVTKKDPDYFYPLLPNQNTENPTTSISSVPWMQDLKKQIAEAKANLSRMIAEFTEDHPDVVGTKNQIALLQSNLDQELASVLKTYVDYYNGSIQALESQKQSTAREKTKYENQLQELSNNIAAAAARQIEFNILLKTQDITHEIYRVLFKKQNELQLLRDQIASTNLPNMRIFELASLPLKPATPNLPLSLALGICLGIIVGFSGSLLEEKRNNPVFNKENRSMNRIYKNLTVAYGLKGGAVQQNRYAVSENISGGGINIQMTEQVPVHTELTLEIFIGNNERISCTGKVIWIDHTGPKDVYHVGIQFSKMPGAERTRILDYLYGKNYSSI